MYPLLANVSKAASQPRHLEADVARLPPQQLQDEDAPAHAGQLASVPGAEGHAVHWLRETQGGQELTGGRAPQRQGAVAAVPWGDAEGPCQQPRGPRIGRGSETTILHPCPLTQCDEEPVVW